MVRKRLAKQQAVCLRIQRGGLTFSRFSRQTDLPATPPDRIKVGEQICDQLKRLVSTGFRGCPTLSTMALSKEFCLAICFLFIILTCQAGQTSDGHAFAPSSGLSTDLAAARDLVATNQLIYGPDHTNTAAAIENLAEIYIQNGQYAEAQPLCGQSVQIRESFTNTDPAKLLKAMVMLAGVYEPL